MTIVRSMTALGLLATVLVAACQPGDRVFQITLGSQYSPPLPVSLTDDTGLVTAITPVVADPARTPNEPSLRVDTGDANGLVLSWLGGACDQDATVRFQLLNGAYVLNLARHEKPSLGGCSGAAVPHAFRISTSQGIPVDSITVTGG